ncbi:MAG: undecaprenyl/decaprenyl-phosphate alpha-N-acetylglucosaminyl 1-phosphate transferase [Candidatus Portiera sp.]|nr:undecaprenyl/decaprenyl-phosphate alpha-N-acetylglucosaminyl 1-phosphate transferase [Portiera sp.]
MLIEGLITGSIALVTSLIITTAILRLPIPAIFFDHDIKSIQKAHTDAKIPRIGGVGIFSGLALSIIFTDYFGTYNYDAVFVLLSFLAFIAGFVEDFSKRISPLYRLIFSFAVVYLACVTLNIGFYHSGFKYIDERFLANIWVAYPIAIIMGGGVMHSINIIDGYNGLSSGIAIIGLAALAIIAIDVGDQHITLLSIALVGATLGTLIFNYPWGKIFIGDGGAYMLGFMIAIIASLLVNRNPEVSPWFPLMVIALPVWETLFSIIRRKLWMRLPATEPDNDHLHNLVYRKIVCRIFAKKSSRFKNSAVAPMMWLFSLATIMPALVMWDNTPNLVVLASAFVFAYCLIYLILYRISD